MVREDGAVLGLKPQFSILDSRRRHRHPERRCGGTTDGHRAPVAVDHQQVEEHGPERRAGLAQAAGRQRAQHRRMMARYEERLAAYQSVDFDDLIGLPLKLLRDFPEVRAKWQALLGHVLVDEYQDTNATQYELLKLLVGERGRFTAVGDDDQSIYGWRGATLDNLKKLPLDYPALKVIKLEQNYRSTSAILRAANNVIGPNPKLFPKTLFSELGEGEPVRVVDADNEEHEAERAVARIQSLRAASNPPPAWKRLRHPVPRQPPGQAVRKGAAPRQHSVQGVGRHRAFSTAPKSRTCAPGSACGSTTTTTRPSCAPSPAPNAASATPRWRSWASLPRSTS
jgi:ATP-dependent DNA helicase Rep